ncbi:winged helix-turn-helix domain-containing protein [Gordonia phosphorivorans]|uniref:Winged helix-turn-helix domain-containing protein n=1 Tax=Gordonia phosphorivorans TaxID=1056982 RepID=A0ABV6H8M1_9ACTN
MGTDLSAAAARSIALAAQGFTDPAPNGPVTRAHFKRVLGRTRLLQMDSVNVLARAHYLPAFSRLGAYDDRLLDTAAWRSTARAPRLLVEYWAHEAALIPVDDWPLFRWRMTELAGGRWRHVREALARNTALVDDILAVIIEAGASTPRDLESALGVDRAGAAPGTWWERGEVKNVCEALFAGGTLSAVRDDKFFRHYDLAERVVGEDRLAVDLPKAEAVAELVRRAAAAHGIATAADLADYYRLPTAEVRGLLGALIEDGTVTEVTVEGWGEPAYLHREASIPRRPVRSTLLSPFDPLVFYRPRTLRLFGFHYRIEIYVPAHKRVHGYYVLPYLHDGGLQARVDLKADRRRGVLQVLAAHHEDGADLDHLVPALAADLAALALWRGLDSVQVQPSGDLAAPLARAVAG